MMHDTEGNVRGVVCVALDITERKRAEEAAEKQCRARREQTYG